MFRKPFFLVLIALALTTMSCRLFSLPVRQVQTGATETKAIEIEAPSDAEIVDLDLRFGAGELTLSPGAEDLLVSGEAQYNVSDFEPNWSSSGNRVTLQAGDANLEGIPNFNTNNIVHTWDLQLGSAPMNLSLEAGAYQGRMDLGGLSLQSLTVADGAADVNLDFSEPNQVEMDSLTYTTGASNVTLTNLANANFSSLFFKGGAGSYELDFSGELQRDANVTVEAGISQVTIIVPADAAVEVNFDGGLSNVDASNDWQQSGDHYSLAGDGPTLTISISMGAGSVNLRTR